MYQSINNIHNVSIQTKTPVVAVEAVEEDDSPIHIQPRQLDTIGYHEAFQFGGSHLRDNVAKVVRQSPVIGQYILEGCGENLGNTSLSYRDWALVTISALASMGDCTDQLGVYVEGALRNGVHPQEILDLFHHTQAFAGNPRAVNALRATWKLLSSAQSELPSTYTESLVRLGDHDTMVRDTHGPGVPIVLIHALSLDSRMYKEVIPSLAKSTGARVIAYDMRGHGHARGAPITKSLEHLCADLEQLLDTLDIKQADVYGASFGGAVAQYFALDYPKRVRSLSAIATSGKATSVLATRATRAEEQGVASLIPEAIIRWFQPETIATNPWCVRYARNCVERARVEEWAAAWRAMSKLDCLERLAELRCPVMSLSGTDDASSKPEMMKKIVEACKNADAEFVPIERGTHMMIMEQPKDVADAMIAFRKKVDSKTKNMTNGV